MRIAFITPEFVTEPSYSGGLANYLGRVSVALVEQGHTVHVFTRSTTPNEELNFQGVTVHRVLPLWDKKMILDHVDPLVPRSFYNPYQDLKAAWCLWRQWLDVNKQIKFDITQVANVMAVGLFFRFSSGTAKIVTRLSSYRPFWDTAAGITVNSGVKTRWLMEKLAIKGIPHAYAPTHFVARQTENGYGLEQIGVVESPFFVEEEKEDYSVFDQYAKDKRFLLFFGRMTQMKGVHILVDSLKTVLKEVEDISVFFIGNDASAPDGTKMSEYIQSQLSEFQDRIFVLNSIRHDKLYPFIVHARLIVLPSLMDNLPNTCLEAMGLGKAVVATTGSCFEQVIKHETSGFLVAPENSEELQKMIVDSWKLSDEKLATIGGEARKTIVRLHPDQAIPNLIQYYQSI